MSRFQPIFSSARRLPAVLAVLLVLFAPPIQVRAQGPPPFPVPNQRNPYPKNHHDPQNTGRALEEKYWGVFNGNQNAFTPLDAESRGFSLNGWVFPQEAANSGAPGTFPLKPAIEIPDDGIAIGGWTQRSAPSTDSRGFYHASDDVVSRDPNNGLNGAVFTWDVRGTNRIPREPDPARPPIMTRYRILVWLPARGAGETRVRDARYRVYYTRPPLRPENYTGAPVEAGPLILYVDQDVSVAGYYPLRVRNADGSLGDAPFIPFYADRQARVELDNTTDDNFDENFAVIADDLLLQQQFDEVRSTPVVTARHGGRKYDDPSVGAQPNPLTENAQPNDFTQASDDPFDPLLPSSLFEAPEFFVNPNAFVAGTSSTSRLRARNPDGTTRPLFSHMQVLVGRTDNVIDPRDSSGTGSVEAGAIYALDWLTGTVVWRFPDRSLLPGSNPRNPFFTVPGGVAPLVPGVDWIDRNGNLLVEDDEVLIVGLDIAGYRIPNNRARQGTTARGGISGSVTFVPRVRVNGSLPVRRRDADGYPVNNPDGSPIFDAPQGFNGNKALAYVGSNNGVLYALDALGNSDSRYSDPPSGAPADAFGQFTPGTTNVIWIFNPSDKPSVVLDNDPLVQPTGTVEPGRGAVPEDPPNPPLPPRQWELLNLPPSQDYVGTGYRRIKPQVRAGTPTRALAPFIWRPNLRPGRYAIYVYIPKRRPDETRITDARYIVNGTPMSPVNQNNNGQVRRVPLGAADGSTFFSTPIEIQLEDTTDNSIAADTYVVADAIEAVPFGTGVPDPGSFGRSSAVVTRERPADDSYFDPSKDNLEQRLFIGSDNGVLFALPATADASTNRFAGAQLPFANHPDWWFQALGSVSATPAVSAREHSNPNAGDSPQRGVYFTTQEGRLYCIDWRGPVTKSNHFAQLPPYNGTLGSADAFNNSREVRPRWVFPQRYRDIGGTDNNPPTDPPLPPDDDPVTGVRLAEPDNLGPIFSAPVLMDFFAADSTANPNDINNYRTYVVLAANDNGRADSSGKLYLLDPAGDRRNFLTNPQRIGAGSDAVAVSHPLDRYTVRARLGNATPAWTHRFQYGTDPLELQRVNEPTADPNRAIPRRRERPTIFFGGLGRMYAVDIDPNTNAFVRWPQDDTNYPGNFPGPLPLPDPPIVPPDDPDALDPPNAAVLAAGLQNRPVLARQIALRGNAPGSIEGIAITGGPVNTRGPVPDPPYNPFRTRVNQDIDDPLTQPTAEEPLPYQYPALFVTTADGTLQELSTNTEGEDRNLLPGSTFPDPSFSSRLGWSLTTEDQANPEHVLLDAAIGPGGTSGPSVATNAVFLDLDPFTLSGQQNPMPPFRPRRRQTNPADPAQQDRHTGQTGFPLDHNGLFNDPYSTTPTDQFGTLQIPNTTNTSATNNQDLGASIVWVFSGGADGVTYAYTPGGFTGGGGSGQGGRRLPTPRLFDRGDPKVDIFDGDEDPTTDDDYTYLFNEASDNDGVAERPNRTGRAGAGGTRISRAAKGKNNFFEWGETVYLVVWDANARRESELAGGLGYFADTGSVRLTITNRVTGAVLVNTTLNLQPDRYEYDPNFVIPPRNVPPGVTPAQLGLAFYKYTLTDASGSAQTPGAYIEVRVTQAVKVREPGPGGTTLTRTEQVGGTGQAPNAIVAAETLLPIFAIANPIDVEGALRDTINNSAINPSLRANHIGPADNSEAAKRDVIPEAPVRDVPPATQDPDRDDYDYYQALTNGNLIERRDFSPYERDSSGDLRRSPGGYLLKNPQYTQPIAGGSDPRFYLPIAASTGYIGHDSTGSTLNTATEPPTSPRPASNLYITNRSRLPVLSRVRLERSDLQWRFWPGRVPNADPTPTGGSNERLTPGGMSFTGVINPLPWDVPPGEAQPWKLPTLPAAGAPGTPNSVPPPVNASQDYPDVPRTNISSGSRSGDLTRAAGVLPPRDPTGVGNPVSVDIKMPRYQPANLVAIDNLTSTYVGPNRVDAGTTLPTAVQGPVQLPRGLSNRRLGGRITPFGYTSRLLVFVDSNGNGVLDLASSTRASNTGVDYNHPGVSAQINPQEEAYREFEVWTGVPVDLRLKSIDTVIDVGTLPHGFGVQNGLLGYSPGSGPLPPGFVPPPLSNLPPPAPGVRPTNPYASFYRSFTIQNVGNTNLWNLRAAQRYQEIRPTGSIIRQTGLRSDLVDSLFGISSFGADPNLPGPYPNFTHITTSLDQPFDAFWATDPFYGTYVAPFGGRHTLHKPRPGAPSPTLLSLPDLPENVPVDPSVGDIRPKVGVAVPLATPVGTYAAPLAIFESHDTAFEYRAAPRPGSGGIEPAGPLYGGRNDVHPGTPGSARPILPEGFESVLRVRRAVPGAPTTYEFLPFTDPSFVLKATVQESALTGQTPDTALPSAGTPPAPASVQSGVLPGVDLFPLVDTSVEPNRPASALTPTAFRSAAPNAGSLHVYFSRNATDDGETGTPAAAPGQPFRLFHTHLVWDANKRVWIASDIGKPVSASSNTADLGRWFTKPLVIDAGNADSSNISPFVLHETVRNANNVVTADAATLFWLNTQEQAGGEPIQTIWYARLDPITGVPETPTPLMDPNAGNPALRPDPALRRFAPKAATVDLGTPTTFVFYYGGVGGRWTLYYAAMEAAPGGMPLGGPRPFGGLPAERPLVIPSALSSASDPSPVIRFVQNIGWVVDLYYSGISRANQNPDIYLTRYRIIGSGYEARLQPVPMPRMERERLAAPTRDPVWVGKHVSWYRTLGNLPITPADDRANLPEIYIQVGGTGTPVPLRPNPSGASPSPTQTAWRFDEATGLLFQSFEHPGRPGLSMVYVDSSAGTVRFRGPGTPSATDIVYADYTPQTQRTTQDAVADQGVSTYLDQTVLPASPTAAEPGQPAVLIRRPAPLRVDRQWVVWQKGAQPGRAATLYYTTRRVGVDLKAIGSLQSNESLRLTAPDMQRAQRVEGLIVQVAGTEVPYDVDFKNGRIYVEAQHEGLPYVIQYQAYPPPTGGAPREARGVLGWIDETTSAQMVSMQRSVNEAQPFAFVDQFEGRIGLTNTNPQLADPTLPAGRLWLFWTSPRGRTYDLFWQTIAPAFESASYSGQPVP